MSELISTFQTYFEFSFVRYALVVGVLIALCSSLLGVTLVLKRLSFIGSGLSNVAFGATAIAFALQLNEGFIVSLPVTILCAIWLLHAGEKAKVKGDAAVALVSVSSIAIGYLTMNMFSKSANVSGDVCATLFGSTSILTLTPTKVWVCVLLSVVVVVTFILFYHKIFAVTFDESFSSATGVPARAYNLGLAVIIAVVIVLAMNLVGALLISALVIFPALSAMRIFKTFKAVTVCSVLVSVVCAMLGILASIVIGTPVGSTIVAVDLAVFLLFCGAGFITSKR